MRIKRQKGRSQEQKRSYISALIVTFCFLLINHTAFTQKVTTTIDRDKILLGEQVELQLKIELNNSSTVIDEWFNLPDTFNHLEVVKRLPIDTLQVQGQQVYFQKIILTSFDTGHFTIPVFSCTFTNQQKALSQPQEITILPVDVSQLKDYNDIKTVLEVEPHTNWLLIIAITVSTLALLIAAVIIFRHYRKKKPITKAPVKPLSFQEVLQQIEALQQKDLVTKHQYKPFFTELINICRTFSDMQMQVSTNTNTTDEYMVLLKGKVGTEPAQVQYFQLLRMTDAVKFAKYIPTPDECETALTTARLFVNTLYQYTTKTKANAV